MNRLPSGIFVTLTALLLTAPFANATLLTPGGICSPCTDFNTATPGTVVADTGKLNWSIGVPVVKETGTFEEQVIRAAGGTLDFYYQVSVTGVGKGTIEFITGTDFTGWLTDVGTNTKYSVFSPANLGTAKPAFIDVTGDGSAVNFSFFTNPVKVSQTTVSLVVNTDSFAYQAGSVGIQDSINTTVNGFAPGPEPSSIALFGIVLAVGGFTLRRRLVRR